MRPRFVVQHMIAIPHPGWRAGKGSQQPPCIVVIAYLDTDGQPWIYDDNHGLRQIPVADDSDAPH